MSAFSFAAPAWQSESGALTEADFYSGSHATGAELEAISYSDTLTDNYVTAQGLTYKLYQSGSVALWRQQQFGYADFGGTQYQYDYDWGTCFSCGSLLRNVTTTFTTLRGGTMFLPSEVTVSPYTGSGGQISQTSYSYNTTTGNLLDIYQYVNATTYLTRSFTYNTNGAIATAVDTNGETTTYTYTGGCNDTRGYALFPTTIQSPVSAVKTTATWNCTGGVPLTSTDANGQTTTLTYADAANDWRPGSIQYPDGSIATVTYPSDTAPDSIEKSMTFNGTSSVADTVTTVDGLGRPILSQRRQGPGSSTYDIVQTTYDYMDRPVTVSAPYSGALNDMTSGGVTTTTYDALSRPLSVTDANLGYTDYSYTKNDVLLTLGPAPTGENTKRKQEEFDGLDRLKSVCELTSTANGGGTCGQSVAQTGYWTEYTRNALGQITAVTQNAQGSATQSRSFSFDWLGRLTSETNPESGVTSYAFDTDSTCGTSNGALVKRVDANGNTTCYAYDALNRTTGISYPSGPNSGATPSRYFVYDAATVDGTAMANVAGKLAEAYTGSPSAKITDLGFSYPDPGANEEDVYQLSPNSGGWYHSYATHQANGALATLALPGVTMNQYLDGEGRPAAASANGAGLVTLATYSAAGEPTAITLASGDSDNYWYNAATGRMTEYQFDINGATDTGLLTWNPSGSLATLQVTDHVPGTGDTETCSYGHDDLGRLASVNCGSLWAQTFTLDSLGNLAKSGNQSFGALYGINNRIASNGSVVPHYDNDGNLLDDPVTGGVNVNAFDAENHMVKLEGVNVTYDALGRAVEAGDWQGTAEFLYGPGGRKLAVMSGGTLLRADVPLPGGGEAVYNAGGLQYYTHADNLGSTRLATTPGHAVYYSAAPAPYGETYAPTGSSNPSTGSFTGQHQDIVGGQYDFPRRELSPIQGRWWTPDPAGLAAVDPNNPQSWNRYAYVGGEPLQRIDPNGLDWTACVMFSCQQEVDVNGSYAGGALGGVGGGPGSGGKPGCWVRNEAPPLSDSSSVNGRLDADDGPYDPGAADDTCATSRTNNPGGFWNPIPAIPVVQPTPPPPPPAPIKHASFLDCVNHGADELNPANLLGLGDSDVAKGLLGGPLSMVASYLGGGSKVSAAASASVLGMDRAAQSAEEITSDPRLTFYPAITTLTDSPAITTWTLPLREIGTSIASFFEKIDPVAIAVDATVVGFVGVGCAAFN